MSFPSSDQYSAKQMEAELSRSWQADPFGFRCSGEKCPSANNCRRCVDKSMEGALVAAFHIRREPGDSACRMFLPVTLVTTYKESFQ